MNKARRSPGRFCPALRLVLVSVPAFSCEHRAPQSVENEKASSGWKSSSSNRFCAGSCPLSVSGVRAFWITPVAARSGAPAHNDLETARRRCRPSAVRPAPILCAFRPGCCGGRLGRACLRIAPCSHCHLTLFHVAENRGQIVLPSGRWASAGLAGSTVRG